MSYISNAQMDAKMTFRQSPAEQVRRSEAAWNLDDKSIQARLDGVQAKVDGLQKTLDDKVAQYPFTRIDKIRLQISPIETERALEEGKLANARKSFTGMMAFIISKIFIINMLINCFSSLKTSYEEQIAILNKIDEHKKSIQAMKAEIDEISNTAWNVAEKLSKEKSTLEGRIAKKEKKIETLKASLPQAKAEAASIGVVRELIKGQKVSLLKTAWTHPDCNWQDKYLEEAKKLMEKEGTSLCTGTYDYHNIYGVGDTRLFFVIKKDAQVQMLSQLEAAKNLWISTGDQIVPFTTKIYTRHRYDYEYQWDPVNVNDQKRTSDLAKVIKGQS